MQGLLVTGDFFSTLGAHPAVGRMLGPADDSEAAAPAIVVSYRYWRTVLAGDPAVVGKPILVGKITATIAGVASPGFLDLDPGVPTDFWLPLSFVPEVARHLPKKNADVPWLNLVARLRTGVNASQAAAAASTIFAADYTNGPDAPFKPTDVPRVALPAAVHGFSTVRDQFARPLFTLLAAVAAVLLLACVNLAGLMLARSTARRKEVAMRTALGASRFRIARQLLTESVLLSFAGGAAGILLGYWGAQALATFFSSNGDRPLQLDVPLDWRVLGFTLLVSFIVGLASGIAPSFTGGQIELVPALKETGNSSSGDAGAAVLRWATGWSWCKWRSPCWYWRVPDSWFVR